MDRTKAGRITQRNLPSDVKAAVKAGQAKQGEEICVMDLRDTATFTEFFIIMHGRSSRQNVALYENIERELKTKRLKPLGVEGAGHGEWILMDYGWFIVHIFSPPARDYYSLEKLWGDAPRLFV